MTQKFKNDAYALLAAPVAPGDLTFTIDSADADRFPVANTGTDPVGTVGKDWFKASLENNAGEIEYVHVRTRTLASGVCGNVIRAQNGSTALAFAAGSVCELRVLDDDIENAINAPEVFEPSMVPVGSIVMYDGLLASLPANWKVCDGSSGTPDLRDKFVVGAGTTYAAAATGGSKDAVVVSHNHAATTAAESTDHTHSGTTGSSGSHDHLSNAAGGAGDGGSLGTSAGSSYPVPWGNPAGNPQVRTSADGAHTHAFTSGGRSAAHTHAVTVDAAGVAGTDKNLPPYYALYYIKRIS